MRLLRLLHHAEPDADGRRSGKTVVVGEVVFGIGHVGEGGGQDALGLLQLLVLLFQHPRVHVLLNRQPPAASSPPESRLSLQLLLHLGVPLPEGLGLRSHVPVRGVDLRAGGEVGGEGGRKMTYERKRASRSAMPASASSTCCLHMYVEQQSSFCIPLRHDGVDSRAQAP
eukprot:763163-Hanusia_phi.AAC.6